MEDDLVRCQSRFGISVENCLELVNVYLRATLVKVEGVSQIQKAGKCVGSFF